MTRYICPKSASITTSMRPLASDATPGGGAVTVDWMRLSPYAASGSFTSRIFDAGGPMTWTMRT